MAQTPVSLLERLRERPDAEAWQQLVDLYRPLLLRWLRRDALQEPDAEDLAQEVLSVVIRELSHFQHNQRPGAFRHWLRTIMVNCLHAFWRSRRPHLVGTGRSDLVQMLAQLEDPHSDLSRRWDQEHDRHVVGRLLQRVETAFTPSTWRAFRRLVLESGQAED